MPELHDLVGVRELLRDRLLGPDGLAGAQRGVDQRCVRGRWGDDHHGLDIGVVDCLHRVVRRPLRLCEVAPGLGGRRNRVSHDDDVGVGDRREVPEMGPAHAAGPQHRDADIVRVFRFPDAHRSPSSRLRLSFRGQLPAHPLRDGDRRQSVPLEKRCVWGPTRPHVPSMPICEMRCRTTPLTFSLTSPSVPSSTVCSLTVATNDACAAASTVAVPSTGRIDGTSRYARCAGRHPDRNRGWLQSITRSSSATASDTSPPTQRRGSA